MIRIENWKRSRSGSIFILILAGLGGLACIYVPTGSPTDTSTSEASTAAVVSTALSPTGSTGNAGDTSTGTSSSSTDEVPSTTTSFTGSGESICGNGAAEAPEQCDDGNLNDSDSCTNACMLAVCGDGIVGPGEGCDDGNQNGSDLCSNSCMLTTCGDDIVQDVEACDDGNLSSGDTCSLSCTPTVVKDVATGHVHNCVLFEDGAVRCWGYGTDGQLGYGNATHVGVKPGDLPAPNVDVGRPVNRLVGGGGYNCGVVEMSKLRCWGGGEDGQLGYEKLGDRGDEPGELPTPDVAVGAAVLQVSAGDRHTCVRVEGGGVRCWGFGMWGQLGYGNAASLTVPGADLPGILDVDDISLGWRHTCVLQQGQVRCWGLNASGQLGQGHKSNIGDGPAEMPPAPVPVGSDVISVAAGSFHTCALVPGGQVKCWGQNNVGQLGYGHSMNVGDDPGEFPVNNVNIGGEAVRLVAGHDHTCALLKDATVRCWGQSQFGQCGNGDVKNVGDGPGEMPPMPVALGGKAVEVWSHLSVSTCALLEDGTLRCWGHNAYGQLGYGHANNIGDDETPASAGPVPF